MRIFIRYQSLVNLFDIHFEPEQIQRALSPDEENMWGVNHKRKIIAMIPGHNDFLTIVLPRSDIIILSSTSVLVFENILKN